MHDQTAVKTEGIDALIQAYPGVKILVDSGYQGVARDHPDQVSAPPRKLKKNAPPEQVAVYQQARKAQPSPRISAEHAIASIKWWRQARHSTRINIKHHRSSKECQSQLRMAVDTARRRPAKTGDGIGGFHRGEHAPTDASLRT
jgi:hypothetical protein